MTSITIPEGVTEIGNYAFSDCKNLTSVKLPASLRIIGIGAFSSTGLTSLTIPDGVTEIGDFGFSGCKNLKSLYLPASLKKIGVFAIPINYDSCIIHAPQGSVAEKYAKEGGFELYRPASPSTVSTPSTSHYSAPTTTSNNTYSNNTHVSKANNASSQQVTHTDNDGCPLLLKIIGLVFGVAAFSTSLAHEEYLDLGIARGTIFVETNWVGIVLGLIIITVILITMIKD